MTSQQSLIDLLLEKRVIPVDVADVVRQLQVDTGKPVEQVLIDVGALTEDDLAAFVSDALHIRYIKLQDVEIDREAIRHVPAAVAHLHRLIPVRRSGNSLVVAFADSSNAEARHAVRSVTDFEIIPFVARPEAIEHALFVHYGEPPQISTGSDSGTAFNQPQSLADGDRVSHLGRSVQLNRYWNFGKFVVDAANQFPLSVAKAIADLQPDTGYNPFHCWGPAGCGKSHLLHAVANQITAHAPVKRFILTSGARFADGLFEVIRDKKLNLFRYLYRETDFLIIDDADALLNREWAQLELVETIMELRKRGGQFILASRENLAMHPRATVQLRDILPSGVVAGFGEYSVEAKLAMASARMGDIELPQETLTYLVRRCGNRMSDLLAILQHVSVMAVRGDCEITTELVDGLLRTFGITDVPTPDDMRQVAQSAVTEAPGLAARVTRSRRAPAGNIVERARKDTNNRKR